MMQAKFSSEIILDLGWALSLLTSVAIKERRERLEAKIWGKVRSRDQKDASASPRMLLQGLLESQQLERGTGRTVAQGIQKGQTSSIP